ncbi:hypothetical protein TraAM80_06185 [Trypanosoma rangeli]|uniref:Uncharacterized protein n=1 Tax=Trypanosoma rangeli TaxID=5698 RepID=A0A3R7KAL5_TRYRA|nr:uncharacterized protein TraAM80_06185 [Trypanosoma rangeli]RNF02733.1 hypothetical protein TraAM80_06185 [Trypanosoma rangeli]|eukprot:RNF02733.1 hypothetical protein TraAM80_06185 [Trypanosoma rangeli]
MGGISLEDLALLNWAEMWGRIDILMTLIVEGIHVCGTRKGALQGEIFVRHAFCDLSLLSSATFRDVAELRKLHAMTQQPLQAFSVMEDCRFSDLESGEVCALRRANFSLRAVVEDYELRLRE